jgi:Flp pilus assembly protein TadB
MKAHKTPQGKDARGSERLARWKVALAICAAIVIAPVLALALLVLVATALPAIPLLALLVTPTWVRARNQARAATPTRPALLPPPPLQHPATS